MKKKTSLIIGSILLIIGICFIIYIFKDSPISLMWKSRVAFMLYGVYLWLIFRFLVAISINKERRNKTLNNIFFEVIVSFFVVIILLLNEITALKVDVFTIIRGCAIFGQIDIAINNLYIWSKYRNKVDD